MTARSGLIKPSADFYRSSQPCGAPSYFYAIIAEKNYSQQIQTPLIRPALLFQSLFLQNLYLLLIVVGAAKTNRFSKIADYSEILVLQRPFITKPYEASET